MTVDPALRNERISSGAVIETDPNRITEPVKEFAEVPRTIPRPTNVTAGTRSQPEGPLAFP